MARKNPVSDRDKAIGRRLREARDLALAKRTALALKIGVSSDQLSSYEHGRVPLPWLVGSDICELLDINQRWLATGEGSPRHFFPLSPLEGADIQTLMRAPFSDIYDRVFKKQFAGNSAQSEETMNALFDDIRKVKANIDLIDDPLRLEALLEVFSQIQERLEDILQKAKASEEPKKNLRRRKSH